MSAYRQGIELAAGGKNEAALIAFESALGEEPTNFRAAFGIGLMEQRQLRHEDAILAFSLVIEMQPRLAEAYYSRALSAQSLGRHEEALTDIDVSLDLDPGSLHALYARSVSLKHLDRDEEAIDACDIILAKTSSYPPATHARATLLSRNGRYTEAIRDFSKCIHEGMDTYDVRLLRGLAYHRTGKLQEAKDDLTVAIGLDPGNGSTYIRRWQVLKDLGEHDLAAEDMKTGIALLRRNDVEPIC